MWAYILIGILMLILRRILILMFLSARTHQQRWRFQMGNANGGERTTANLRGASLVQTHRCVRDAMLVEKHRFIIDAMLMDKHRFATIRYAALRCRYTSLGL